jgi:hypothetical protein
MSNFNYMDSKRSGQLSPRERFDSSYIPEPNSGCWLWFGTQRSYKGYGAITINSIAVSAHRFSWELHRSKIPEGLYVCHRCDNPYCVNPDHLFIGTPKQNTQDMIRKNRRSKSSYPRAYGERSGGSKLKTHEVLKILADNRDAREIAKDYSVTYENIMAIKTRKTWRHLEVAGL